MYLYIWQARLGEGGEKQAREGREWERGELYKYIG